VSIQPNLFHLILGIVVGVVIGRALCQANII
jgi:hypothetical protein